MPYEGGEGCLTVVVGEGVVWLVRSAVAVVVLVVRVLLVVPAGRETRAVLQVAWRAAGFVSRAAP